MPRKKKKYGEKRICCMEKLKIRLTDVLPIKSTIYIRERLNERMQADRRKIKKDNDEEIGVDKHGYKRLGCG